MSMSMQFETSPEREGNAPPSGVRCAGRSTTVLLGDDSAHIGDIVERAAARSQSSVIRVGSLADASRVEGTSTTTVLVPYAAGTMAELGMAVRATPGLADATLVAIADELDDVTFEEAFSAGFDECVPPEEASLTKILRAIERSDKQGPAHRGASVVVADVSRMVRVAVARAFRMSGFSVVFAGDAEELAQACQDPTVATVVVSSDLAQAGADGGPLATWARTLNPDAAWIINTPPPWMHSVRARIGADDVAISVHDAYATPSTLLFVANALRHRDCAEQRRNPRMLYGTAASFRPAGRREAHVGFSFNVSIGGAYIRTLAPPDVGERIWIELVPPRCDRLVHLEAEVVWRRTLGNEAEAVVPPGFGIRFVGGSERDMTAYGEGCVAFARDRG